MRRDIYGFYWETVVDVGFIGIDIYNLTTEQGWNDWKNWAALGVDLVFTAVPFATGGGQIVKAGDKITDLSKVTVVGETMTRVQDFAKSVNAADNLYNGLKSYGKLSSKGVVGKAIAEVGGKLQNASWLYSKLRKGYTIVDIGIDTNRATRSSSYIMETVIMTIWKARNILKSAIKLGK